MTQCRLSLPIGRVNSLGAGKFRTMPWPQITNAKKTSGLVFCDLEFWALGFAASAAMARHVGKVAVIGFCWGGLLAWAAASELPLAAAVCYYGARIAALLPKVPACPTMLHFGEQDRGIPLSEVEAVRNAYPRGVYHLYAAGHGFANEDRSDHYNPEATALARSRTNAFLALYIG